MCKKMFDFSLTYNLIHPGSNILRLQCEPAEGSMKPHMGKYRTVQRIRVSALKSVCSQITNNISSESQDGNLHNPHLLCCK